MRWRAMAISKTCFTKHVRGALAYCSRARPGETGYWSAIPMTLPPERTLLLRWRRVKLPKTYMSSVSTCLIVSV